jgi:LacI family transcriptional regulator
VRRKTPHILLMIETSRTFGREIVEGIARYAFENGPWSIQFEDRGLDSSPPEWLKEWRGEGIISRTINKQIIGQLSRMRAPLVELFGDAPHVRSDTDAAAELVYEHFHNSGFRNFAHFAYEENSWIRSQRDFFQRIAIENGGVFFAYPSPQAEHFVPGWHESYRPRAIEWLRSLPTPIGIYAAMDLHAARLLGICKEIGLAVPEKAAIVGVGNDPVLCETSHPMLSSIDLDGRRFGYEAAKLLDRKMSGERTEDFLIVPPNRVEVRQSTDIAIVEDPDLAQALRYIREFALTDLDVDRVAREVGLSRRVLERRFRQFLGTTPKDEIVRFRIERAKMLLARTDQTIESIVRKSGYRSSIYFTRAFRREVGETPHAYRRKHRIP